MRRYSLVLALLLAPPATGQCTPRWSHWFYGGNAPNDNVHAFAAFDEDGGGPQVPALFVGGDFTMVAGQETLHIARWYGQEWSPVTGVSGGGETSILCMTVFDPDGAGPASPVLVAGGEFTKAGGQAVRCIAAWDGKAWSNVGGGVAGLVQALTVFDADGDGPELASLYVGGLFAEAGDTPVANVARWDGLEWHALPEAPDDVRALAAFDDDGPGPNQPRLYAGSGTAVLRLDGDAWTQIGQALDGGGLYNGVRALAVYDWDGAGPGLPRLHAGGSFSVQGGANIAFLDGNQWAALAGGTAGYGPLSVVRALAINDDDADGPNSAALFAGGTFSSAGNSDARHLAKWDGAQWHKLDGSPGDVGVSGLIAFDEDRNGPMNPVLYAGGSFTAVGAIPSSYIARWGCPPPNDCYPDCDGSGVLDFFDFLCFVNLFNAGEGYADCDGDDEPSLFDFLCFVNSFNAGC